MGKGHDESFVASRADVGHATRCLLRAITVLVQRVLGLPARPSDHQKRVAVLERQLARARADKPDGRKALALVARLEAELTEVRRELAEAQAESARVRAACDAGCATCRAASSAADSVLDAAATALCVTPPIGMDIAYLDAFLTRHRGQLCALVEGALARRTTGPSS